MDNIYTASIYTALMMAVSYFYYVRGRQKGAEEAVDLFLRYEHESALRMNEKFKEELNVAITKQ